jgi:hypothetical protein
VLTRCDREQRGNGIGVERVMVYERSEGQGEGNREM